MHEVHLSRDDAAGESGEGNSTGGERELHGEVEENGYAESVRGVDVELGRCPSEH